MCTLGFLCILATIQMSGSVWDGVTDSDREKIVNLHNSLRRQVTPTARNMLKMSWNYEAEYNAQEWAYTCPDTHSFYFDRVTSTTICGENMFFSDHFSTWEDVIGSWFIEVEDWKYSEGSTNGGVVGHFTQLVWYRSFEIGCGMTYCPHKEYSFIYVCHYCPAGNYNLAYPYEKGEPCGACPNNCDDGLCTNPCLHYDHFGNCPAYFYFCPWVTSLCPATCLCFDEIF